MYSSKFSNSLSTVPSKALLAGGSLLGGFELVPLHPGGAVNDCFIGSPCLSSCVFSAVLYVRSLAWQPCKGCKGVCTLQVARCQYRQSVCFLPVPVWGRLRAPAQHVCLQQWICGHCRACWSYRWRMVRQQHAAWESNHMYACQGSCLQPSQDIVLLLLPRPSRPSMEVVHGQKAGW